MKFQIEIDIPKKDPRIVNASLKHLGGNYEAQFAVTHATKSVENGVTQESFIVALSFTKMFGKSGCISFSQERTIKSAIQAIQWVQARANIIVEALADESEPAVSVELVSEMLGSMTDVAPLLFDYALSYKDPLAEIVERELSKQIPTIEELECRYGSLEEHKKRVSLLLTEGDKQS